MLTTTFYGTRGSCACSGPEFVRYGGNTSCVVIESDGRAPLLLDAGSGARVFGQGIENRENFRASILVSHLHYDHVLGLPFFTPVISAGSELDIYGPAQQGSSFADAMYQLIQPPFFPVSLRDIGSQINFHDVGDDSFNIEGIEVTSKAVPHVGPTVGYRLDVDGVSIAYVSDHQQPTSDNAPISPAVLELCRDVDVLIHDAQYTKEEFETRSTWGHSTIDYTVDVALASGAKQLVMFHHDPMHSDDTLDRLSIEARDRAKLGGLDSVICAADGMKLSW